MPEFISILRWIRDIVYPQLLETNENVKIVADNMEEVKALNTSIEDGVLPFEKITTTTETVASLLTLSASNGDVVIVKEDGLVYTYEASQWICKSWKTVYSIAELEGLDVSVYSKAKLLLDGRSGDFIYDDNQSAVNNGGTVFDGWVRQFSGAVNVKWFGVTGNGVTDDTNAVQMAVDYATSNNLILDFSSYKIRTSSTITLSAQLDIRAGGGCVFQRYGSLKDFPCFVIEEGNGVRKEFGTIDGYQDALVVRSSVSDIKFKTISNCVNGIIIDANIGSNLDNIVNGVQIGICTNAIMFRQNGIQTQQGNEVNVNFISNCLNQVVFEDNGTHTEDSNWDSNVVRTKAVDPYYLDNATMVLNNSSYPVHNITMTVDCWAGGWNLDDNTMMLLKGKFNVSTFKWNFATAIKSNMFDAQNYSSNTFYLYRKSLFTVPVEASNTIGLSNFNNGKQLTSAQNQIKITTPIAIGVGQKTAVYVYHALSNGSALGDNFFCDTLSGSGNTFAVNATQANTEESGLIRLYITNISNATIQSGYTFNIQLRMI